MKEHGKLVLFLLSIAVILFVFEMMAQDTPTKTLVINGKTVDAAVVQVEGRSYADIEGLVQSLGGSVSFEQNQIALTIPGPPPPEAPQSEPSDESMSKEFQQIGVFTLAEMREWRGAIGSVVTSGMPVAGTWSQDYHDHVEADLMHATLAASTDQDRQALQLLQNEYALLSDWADKVLGERKALNAERNIDPNSLQNDAALAKISKCSKFLSSMIVSGAFSDDSGCH